MGFESAGMGTDAFLKRKGNTQWKGPCEVKAATRSKKPCYAWTCQKPGRQTSTLPFASKLCSSDFTLTSDFQLPRPGQNMLLLFFVFWFLVSWDRFSHRPGWPQILRRWMYGPFLSPLFFFFLRNIGAHCQDYTLISPFTELGVGTIYPKLRNFYIK